MTQSMLEPEERVKNARKTARVKGKSYRQGIVYISSKHKDIGRMEVCHYDARHHIINKLEHEISLWRVLREDQQTK